MSSFAKYCLVVLLAGHAGAASAEAAGEAAIPAVAAGRERFIDACAFCHGLGGQGNGEAAPMLEKPPADLTQLSRNNQGKFPLAKVYGIIDGRAVMGSHGSREMPVWGDMWKKNVAAEYAEYYIKGRILELILYLDSIQL